MSTPVETWFCARAFRLVEGEAESAPRLMLSTPRATEDGTAWRCSWRLEELADDVVREARGADGADALQNALRSAATLFYTSLAWKQGRLTYRGKPDSGLPLFGDLTPEDFRNF